MHPMSTAVTDALAVDALMARICEILHVQLSEAKLVSSQCSLANNLEIATPAPRMNINAPEVLTRKSYKRWSILMQHYLEAQDLWEIVVQSPEEYGPNTKERNKKNSLALYAIKASCEAEAFQRIQD